VSYPKEISDQLICDSQQLIDEVNDVVSKLVNTTWNTGSHHYYASLYAYLMVAFSHIDLYSKLWRPAGKKQTPRMRKFLGRYLPKVPLAHALAIQLWRHTLMHTGRPREIKENSSNISYKYLVSWGAPQLPIEQHYLVSGSKFTLGLQYLLDDFHSALLSYLAEADTEPLLCQNARDTWPSIIKQSFDL